MRNFLHKKQHMNTAPRETIDSSNRSGPHYKNKIHIYTHTHLEVDRISTRQSYSIFFLKIIFYLGMTPKKIWSGAHHPQKGLAQEEAEWRRLRTPSPEPGPWRHHVGETGYTSNGMIPYGYLT